MEYNPHIKTRHNQYARIENVFNLPTLKEIETISKQHPPINDNGGDVNYKRNLLVLIPNSSISVPTLFLDKLYESIFRANSYFNMDLTNIMLTYAEYKEKVSGLSWHMDISGFPHNTRKLSFSINLNNPNEYEGGDLEFRDLGEEIKISPKSLGGITIFPSFLSHRVTPITKGIRKVLVGFVEGPPYK